MKHGFILTPYREASEGKVSNKIKYLNALEEEDYVIVLKQCAKLDMDNNFQNDQVDARKVVSLKLFQRKMPN